MRHARSDYDRIQDPDNKIGKDEPVFLLRAQDKSAPATLRYWAAETARNGGDIEIIHRANCWAEKMEDWQHNNCTKAADMPEGV